MAFQQVFFDGNVVVTHVIAISSVTLMFFGYQLMARGQANHASCPPLAVLIRSNRPSVILMGLATWIVYRCGFGSSSNDPSLMDLLVQLLDRVKSVMRTCSDDSIGRTPSTTIFNLSFILLEDLLVILMAGALYRFLYCLSHYTLAEWKEMAVQRIFQWAKEHVPTVRNELERQKSKVAKDIEIMLHKDDSQHSPQTQLPRHGRSHKELMELLKARAKKDHAVWQEGKVSGAVYTTQDDEHMEMIEAVYGAYALSNPLHADVWPSLRQMDAEIVAMTANLLSGTTAIGGIKHATTPNNGHLNGYGSHMCGDTPAAPKTSPVVGTTSSCGSESIILAIKAHRVYYGTHRGIAFPELICGPTAHASVDKACDLMNIRKVCVPSDPVTHTMIPAEIEKRVTSNTIMIFASAPTYPQGMIDPIEELSEIAERYDIGLHVDACLGGWVLPFARQLGYAIPNFGFELPGVTSMTADTHKFAYASKGTSVVLYRDKELRHAQYFAYSKWTGGLYVTPTIPGSRPGGLLACAWATLQYIGESGYLTRVQSILEASRMIADGITSIPGLRVLGTQQPTMVVCFASDEVDIYRVADLLAKRGWHLNSLQHPASLHVCVTLNTVPVAAKLVEALREVMNVARTEDTTAAKKGGTAGIYGMSGSLPAGPVNEILNIYTDEVYTA